MKRLMPCFLLLPLLSSCVVQEGYYEPGYYPPPPPEVEIHRHGHHQHGYRQVPAPQGRVEHGHGNNQGNFHGNNPAGGRPAVVNPGRPQMQARPQPQVQQQAQAHPNARGHDEDNRSAVHTAESGPGAVVEHH